MSEPTARHIRFGDWLIPAASVRGVYYRKDPAIAPVSPDWRVHLMTTKGELHSNSMEMPVARERFIDLCAEVFNATYDEEITDE